MSKYNVLRYFTYGIEILILFIIEQTPYLMGNSLGIKPVFIISAAVTIAMLEENIVGLAFGIFSGVIMDTGSGNIFGFNALFLGVLCFAVSVLVAELIKTNMLTVILMSLVCVFILFSAQFLFLYVMRGYDETAYAYTTHYLPIMLYSVLPSPLIYILNKFLFVVLRERE